MARKKSLTAQLVQAYQEAKKAKAAEAKRLQQEEARRARAAEQERLQKERAAAKEEREQAQRWAAAQREKKRQDAERKRKAEQVERDLARRQEARERQAAQKERERKQKAEQAVRRAKQEHVEALKAEAQQRTADVQAREATLSRVLVDRSPGLRDHCQAMEHALVGGATAFIEAVEGVLAGCDYPAGLRRAWRLAYAPESRELMVDVDLPGQDIIPPAAGYRYKAADPPAVVPQPRKEAETKELYRQLVARLALRAVDEVLAVTPPAVVTSVAFNGHVQAKDRATGRTVRPCLVSVRTERDTFAELILDETELDPVLCLRHLNAIVSQHPYDLEPVRPVVTFDLSKYKFVDEIDIVAGLDSRPDLVALDPTEFEHLVRRLFEAIGLKAWVTQASRDDGIDAVATNEDPIIGGLCIIQAKRYKNVVPAEAVRALAGVMHDKAAAKGILVTTSWFGTASKDFAQRTGRMELIDGRGLKALLKEHLNIDALLGLPKLPTGWHLR
ncbi:restriction endonuclease [Streptomyces sp. MI02-7b]|uniref:restriction endonuclease n=1 Tax=Streptomyces sp. MI02-7b TaxID=462941 RepID=UPI0029BE45B0|nr:restriction endonuclease [Streptomyces sp. MI02-7b]MDX3078431.1 restriction endonuclease [Streptomyces sp. MI02-7b]